MPVNKGDTLIVPSTFTDENKIHIEWSQSWSSRSGDYYSLAAVNNSQGDEQVLYFVQTDYFNEDRLGQKTADGMYQIQVDDQYQYGQKNSDRDARWVCLHDKDRKPYQHRFLEPVLSQAGDFAVKATGLLGFAGPEGAVAGKIVDNVVPQLENAFGDYLHDF